MAHRTSSSLLAAAVACVAALGCKNSNYCEGNPDNDCRATWDASNDGSAAGCTSSTECAAPAPVCDTSDGTCVQCIAPSEIAACTGTTPVCDSSHDCRGCETHAECTSQTCLPDGSCADASTVAYVSATGSGNTCTQASPCPLLADAVGKNLPYIKVAASGAAHASSTVTIDGKAVTILAEPGAVLDRDGDGPILEVRSANADVKIVGLTVSGGTSSSGTGVLLTPNGGNPKLELTRVTVENNQGGGITATGGTLTVSQSIIALNTGGGIAVAGSGTFVITNNFIYRNGDQNTATYGGVNLIFATTGANVFQFNTIVDNAAAVGSGGVSCDVATFIGANNIVARNSLAGSATVAGAQTKGTCTYPTSKIQNDVVGLGFVDSEAPAPFDYALTAGSSAIDFATTTSPIVIDQEGDVRPQGAQKDCGADEYRP